MNSIITRSESTAIVSEIPNEEMAKVVAARWKAMSDEELRAGILKGYQQADDLCTMLKNLLPYKIQVRPQPKKVQRVREKLAMDRPGAAYKAITDAFIAIRIECWDLSNIHEVGKILKSFFLTGNIPRPIDTTPETGDIFFMAFGVYGDYPVEIQIGDPFAFAVFTMDSAIRGKTKEEYEALGLRDLWENNFYTEVKKKILGTNPDYDVGEGLKAFYKLRAEVPKDLANALRDFMEN